MKLLFKYTTRSRRSNFLRGYDSIINQLANYEDYHILISVDKDDSTMFPLPILQGNYTFVVGNSKNKIDAINRDINDFDYDWDILINMSDDMIFTKNRFDDIIRAEFYKNLDQYIHFNDGNQAGNVCTMHIVGREYYNRFKYIYHPDYISLWCDVENDVVAKQLGCYKYMGDTFQLFSHLHPAWGLAKHDELSIKTEDRALWIADEITFNKRKKINFGL